MEYIALACSNTEHCIEQLPAIIRLIFKHFWKNSFVRAVTFSSLAFESWGRGTKTSSASWKYSTEWQERRAGGAVHPQQRRQGSSCWGCTRSMRGWACSEHKEGSPTWDTGLLLKPLVFHAQPTSTALHDAVESFYKLCASRIDHRQITFFYSGNVLKLLRYHQRSGWFEFVYSCKGNLSFTRETKRNQI